MPAVCQFSSPFASLHSSLCRSNSLLKSQKRQHQVQPADDLLQFKRRCAFRHA